MKNKVKSGKTLTYTVPEDAKIDFFTGLAMRSGEPVLIGNLFGIPSTDAKPGELLNIDLVGEFDLKKRTDEELRVGQKLYFDQEAKLLTGRGGLPLVAVCTLPAALNDELVQARLIGIAIDSIVSAPAPPEEHKDQNAE